MSQLDIVNALRCHNGLTLLTLTADGLRHVLEHRLGTLTATDTPGAFPQFSGVNFSFDPTKAPGARIRNAVIVNEAGEILEMLVRDGVLVGDAAREIRIVTLNFLANGSDSSLFATPGKDRVDLIVPGQRTGVATFAEDGSEQDALAEFLAARHATPETAYNAPNTPVELDTRIQQTLFRLDTVQPLIEFGRYRTATFRGDAETLRNPMTNLVPAAEKVAGTVYISAPDDLTAASLGRFRTGDGDIAINRIDVDGTVPWRTSDDDPLPLGLRLGPEPFLTPLSSGDVDHHSAVLWTLVPCAATCRPRGRPTRPSPSSRRRPRSRSSTPPCR